MTYNRPYRAWIEPVTAIALSFILPISMVWFVAPPAIAAGQPTTEELLSTPEVAVMVGIGAEITERIVTLDEAERSALAVAISTNDVATEATLLGYTTDELEALAGRLQREASAILERFPSLEEVVRNGQAPCGSFLTAVGCDASLVVGNPEGLGQMWAELSDAIHLVTSGENLPPRSGCDWLKLVVGLIVCAYGSGGNPLIYVACAYLVYCSYCWGPVRDAIC